MNDTLSMEACTPSVIEPINPHACPVCGGNDLRSVIEIPALPVFCNVLWPTRQQALQASRGDLHLVYCNTCGHIFNQAFDPALVEYTPTYENSLHFSPRFQAFAESLADRLIESYDIRGKSVIDIGCGKGDFLQLICERGANTGFGFDPSYEPDLVDRAESFTVIQDLYGDAYAGYRADLISCRHVLEHISDPNAFLQTVRRTIGDRLETVVYFEVPNALCTLRDLAIWDLIYEHCAYFSPASLAYVFESNGFRVEQVEATFGGQYLSLEAFPSTMNRVVSSMDLDSVRADVEAFARRFREKVQTWRDQFARFAAAGQKVVLWGAGSKGVTLCNLLQLHDRVSYIVDINPRKQGRFVAGTGQQIVGPDFMTEYRPDVVVVMNGLYKEEIGAMLDERGVKAEVLVA